MDFEDIKLKIVESIKEISDNDPGVWRTIEQNICSHLAERIKKRFPNHSVDVEPRKENGHRPDIVIHERDIQDNNLVAIEVKKRPNTAAVSHDLEKIRTIFFAEPYCYKYGLFISIGPLPSDMPEFDQDKIGIIKVDGWLIEPSNPRKIV